MPSAATRVAAETLRLLPRKRMSRALGRIAALPASRAVLAQAIDLYARAYAVDLAEAEVPPGGFATFDEFFTRRLKPGARPVEGGEETLVSPADGLVEDVGPIEVGARLHVKGREYEVGELLGDPADAARFEGGSFVVVYLSPRDYHRVHTPRAGTVSWLRYLPGTLWPVFPAATRKVEGLFGRNERLVFRIDTDLGPILQVMVGAFGVGRMTTVVSDITTNTDGLPADRALTPAPSLDRCAELGRFELGSTVILLLEPGKVEWTVQPGDPVRLGRPIARVLPTRT